MARPCGAGRGRRPDPAQRHRQAGRPRFPAGRAVAGRPRRRNPGRHRRGQHRPPLPGDRVDVILTQKFHGENAPLTRRSVSETVVEDLRVLAIDADRRKGPCRGQHFRPDRDARSDAGAGGKDQRRDRARQIVADLAQRQRPRTGSPPPRPPRAGQMGNVKPTWAGDVSPALSGAKPPEKSVAVQPPPVAIIHGSQGGSRQAGLIGDRNNRASRPSA